MFYPPCEILGFAFSPKIPPDPQPHFIGVSLLAPPLSQLPQADHIATISQLDLASNIQALVRSTQRPDPLLSAPQCCHVLLLPVRFRSSDSRYASRNSHTWVSQPFLMSSSITKLNSLIYVKIECRECASYRGLLFPSRREASTEDRSRRRRYYHGSSINLNDQSRSE